MNPGGKIAQTPKGYCLVKAVWGLEKLGVSLLLLLAVVGTVSRSLFLWGEFLLLKVAEVVSVVKVAGVHRGCPFVDSKSITRPTDIVGG